MEFMEWLECFYPDYAQGFVFASKETLTLLHQEYDEAMRVYLSE